MKSIGKAAEIFGISVRTLRYYDSIGLLCPSEISESGYRYYSDAEINRLREILFYKELGFKLEDISGLINHVPRDNSDALNAQKNILLMQRKKIDEIIQIIDDTTGDKTMEKYDFNAKDIKETKEKFAAEVKERWGNTEEFRASQKKDENRTETENSEMQADANRIFADFAKLVGSPANSAPVQALVEQWQAHITKYHYPCTKEILACLGQMYTADERFTENLDSFGKGTAELMSHAIEVYTAV